MKAYKLTTGELVIGTEILKENNKTITIKNLHIITPNMNGIGLVPFDFYTNKNKEVIIYKDKIVAEFEINEEIITQLKAKESGIKIEKPQPNFKQSINEKIL